MEHSKPLAAARSSTHRRAGFSIRLLSTILFVTAILAIAFAIFELQRNASLTHALYEMERERQRCDMAIQQFMDGSDYLTTQVQQFAVKGDRAYMDRYWKEVYETKSRDAAMETILSTHITPEEREAAAAGKRESDSLINGEIRAMRLMSESLGIQQADMPKDVAVFRLDGADATLDAGEKQDAAIAYVFGPDYSISKDTIRGSVNAFRNEIANRYAEESLEALAKTEATTIHMEVGLGVFFLFLLGSVAGFAHLVVAPVAAFSRELSRYRPGQTVLLPEEVGAREIRQFAGAFNTLSLQEENNRQRLERLGYIDFLTDVPNRASLVEYVSRMIAENRHPLGLMIIDIDNFKHFNDTYGHATGDQVLRLVARAVYSAQPAQNGISGRLCGEEFIIASQNADEASLRATAETVLENVRRICGADVRMPDAETFSVRVSIGGMLWHGETPADFIHLLSIADKALYYSKETGKDRYTFYSDIPAAV